MPVIVSVAASFTAVFPLYAYVKSSPGASVTVLPSMFMVTVNVGSTG